MAYWTGISILSAGGSSRGASRCGNSPGRTMPENEQSCVNVELLRMNKVGFPLFSRLIMPRCQIFASVGATHGTTNIRRFVLLQLCSTHTS